MNKESMIDILVKNLCMEDYIGVTMFISNLEEENQHQSDKIVALKEINKLLLYQKRHLEDELYTLNKKIKEFIKED